MSAPNYTSNTSDVSTTNVNIVKMIMINANCPETMDLDCIPSAAEYTTEGQGVVSVFIGAEKKKYSIHKQLINAHSPFFRTCFGNAHFVEGQTQEVSLPEENVDTIDWMVTWMYMLRFDFDNRTPPINVILDLYLMADRFMMFHLKNYLVDLVRGELLTETLQEVARRTVNENKLPDGSQLRKFIVDQFAYTLANDKRRVARDRLERLYPDSRRMLSQRFSRFFTSGSILAREISKRYLEYLESMMPLWPRRTDVNPYQMRGCVYHKHGDHVTGYADALVVR